jgi:hypothetical protein
MIEGRIADVPDDLVPWGMRLLRLLCFCANRGGRSGPLRLSGA